MRFLKLLFTYLLVGGTLLGAFFILVMFVLSYTQVAIVSRAVSTAKQMARKPSHAEQCLIGEATEEYPLSGYQVKFENDTDFVVEALCASSVKGPFEVSRHTLRFGVKKAPSFSGILFSTLGGENSEARMVFQLGYASWLLEAGSSARVEMKPFMGKEFNYLPGNAAAKASCEGWGYKCCNPLTQVGVGVTVAEKIVSCNDSCYTTCLERPSILVFTTESDLNPSTREISLKKPNTSLIFSYSVQDIDSESLLVSIDYGDGQFATSTNQTDQFSHMYECAKDFCSFPVKLTVTDSDNLENSRTRISDITVQIR